jgi:iron(III) transport system permease protein
MLLPPVYLGIRAFGGEAALWDLLATTRTLGIIWRTVLLIIIVTGLSIALAIPLAWLTERTDIPLRGVLGVLTALPLVMPSYVYALVVVIALGPKGMVQGWLEPLGVDRLPEVFGLPGAAFTLVVLSYPYVLLPVRAALARMDPGLEEASRSLGRPRSATFVLVTLPLLRPAIVAGGLLVALYTLSDFGAVSLLRYQTFTWSIFIQYDSAFDRTLAAGLSLVLVGIALTLLFVESFTRGRGTYHRVTPGTARRASLVRLGAWRYPAAGFVWTVVSIALFAPLAVLMYWVVRGVSAGEPLDILWTAGRNSLYVSGLAAGAAAVAAVPVAVLSVRFPGLLSAAIERLTFVGFALPGMAVALAFVFFASAYAAPLYQTLLLLVLAYMVLFLPAAVGATQASLRQVSPRLEEVARGLGRTPMLAFVSVTLPLLYRGVAAGAALVFLLAMKELPATLILSPIGFKTLATAIWSASEEAFFARAAAPALLLVLVASVPLALMEVRRSRGASAMQK